MSIGRRTEDRWRRGVARGRARPPRPLLRRLPQRRHRAERSVAASSSTRSSPVIVAAVVAARREWFVRLAGIAVPLATLAAFSYTHSQHTLFGFQGDGLDPSPQAQIVLIAEIAAVVLLAATFFPGIAERDRSSSIVVPRHRRPWSRSAALIAFGAYWANEYDTATTERGGAVCGGDRRLLVRSAGAHRAQGHDGDLDQRRPVRAQHRRRRLLERSARRRCDVPVHVRHPWPVHLCVRLPPPDDGHGDRHRLNVAAPSA